MKKNISIRLAPVLLCMVLVSGYMVSGILAKYTVGAGTGDSARVAALVVDVNCVNPVGEIRLSEEEGTQNTVEFPFTVVSNSEIAVDYTVEVHLAEALPDGVTVELKKIGESESTMVELTSVPVTPAEGEGGVTGQVYSFPGDYFGAGVNRVDSYALVVTANPNLTDEIVRLIDLRVCFEQEVQP